MNNHFTNNTQPVSRFYNKILFRGARVIKGVPKDRFSNETKWFKAAKKRIPGNIPHVYSCNKAAKPINSHNLKYYELQAINGSNLYQWAIVNKENFSEIFNRLIQLTKKLHSETRNPERNDIFGMYFLKPKIALVEFIKKQRVNTNIIIINNRKFSDPVKKLESIYKHLEKRLLNTKYTLIHGDLTMSNTLVAKEGKLYLIDPRGSFGNTNLYGDVRYDVAKIYYSIVGNFDSLNNNKFNYKRKYNTINSHSYSIVDNGFGDYSKRIIEEFGEQYDIIRFIHATIWLSLIPHLANNPEQQWCAFCHGINLLNTINDEN